MIQIKNAKIMKSSRHYSITIPKAFIKNGQVDPELEYSVALNPLESVKTNDQVSLEKEESA